MYLVKKYEEDFYSGMKETILGVFDDPEVPKSLILEEAGRQMSKKYFTRKGKPLLKSRNGYDWFRKFRAIQGDSFYGITWTVSAPGMTHVNYYYTIIKIETNELIGKI